MNRLSISNIKKNMYAIMFDDFDQIIKATRVKTERVSVSFNNILLNYYITRYRDIDNNVLFWMTETEFGVLGSITGILMNKYGINKQELETLIKNVMLTNHKLNIDIRCSRPVELKKNSIFKIYEKFIGE